jgi:hypothetical protein
MVTLRLSHPLNIHIRLYRLRNPVAPSPACLQYRLLIFITPLASLVLRVLHAQCQNANLAVPFD